MHPRGHRGKVDTHWQIHFRGRMSVESKVPTPVSALTGVQRGFSLPLYLDQNLAYKGKSQGMGTVDSLQIVFIENLLIAKEVRLRLSDSYKGVGLQIQP